MAGKRRSILPTGALFGLLLGAVIIPAVLAISVGIVALVLYREAFDIVLGVLVLSFAAMALTGGVVAIAFLRRSAQLAEMQTDFIANVSHELRTPLAGIKLLVETLGMGRADGPEDRVAVVLRMGKEVRRLEDLVMRILDWRRLDSAAPQLELGELNVQDLIEEAIDAATSDPALGRVEVVKTFDDTPSIWGDRRALTDALRNLIHNAAKYGAPHGPIAIRVCRKENDVQIAVRDQGPGIPKSEWRRVFERFYRIRHRDRPVSGTGLGLAIVRRVVELHRGRVWLESEPGRETVFTMQLPLGPANKPGAKPS